MERAQGPLHPDLRTTLHPSASQVRQGFRDTRMGSAGRFFVQSA
jgi:hypothetical protein